MTLERERPREPMDSVRGFRATTALAAVVRKFREKANSCALFSNVRSTAGEPGGGIRAS